MYIISLQVLDNTVIYLCKNDKKCLYSHKPTTENLIYRSFDQIKLKWVGV